MTNTRPLREDTLFSLDGTVLSIRVRPEDIDIIQQLLNTYSEGFWQSEVLVRAVAQVDATLVVGIGSYLAANVMTDCPECGLANLSTRAKCVRCRASLLIYRRGVQDA